MEEKAIVQSFFDNKTEESFFPLYNIFYVRIRRYLLLRGVEISVAEDLTQEVLFKVYQNSTDLRDLKSFYGWIYAIARNSMISHYRRQQSRLEEIQYEPLSAELTGSLAIEPDVLRKLQLSEWLAALSDEDGDLLLMRYVEGLSYEELAIAFEMPLGTIKWRISELRKKLAVIITGT